MKNLFFITILTYNISLIGQDMPLSSLQFFEENQKNLHAVEINLDEISIYDLSRIWIEHQDAVLGFIGENYQRIFIHYISVIKNPNNKNEYYIYGKSKIDNNIVEFQGIYQIIHVYKLQMQDSEHLYTGTLKSNDMDLINLLNNEKYFILAKYNIFQNPLQKGTGIFKGVIKSNFYYEKEEIWFDDLEIDISDNFNNNQHVGIWQSYETGIQKPCNWGTYRIPYSNDLDVGVGEFSPNYKYLNMGWDIYHQAYIIRDSAAIKEEENIWWKN